MADVTKMMGRLVYIEPNDLVKYKGVHSVEGIKPEDMFYLNSEGDRREKPVDNHYWNPEELTMSVDLQVVIPNREDCGTIGFDERFAVSLSNEQSSPVGKYMSFLQGTNVDETNSEVSKNNPDYNQLTTSYLDSSYTELYKNSKSNTESLGIESIDINFDQHFYPQVTIKFIDVRGFSLMMPTEEAFRQRLEDIKEGTDMASYYVNFFRALFHFPYPRFLLSVKGFYGNKITFMLAVNEFKNNFNSQTGNFEVTISFIGHMYGLYTDLPLNMLIVSPYYKPGDTNVHTKGAYWSSDYKFDNGNGGDGGEMITFIDLIAKCDHLNVEANKLKEGNGGSSESSDKVLKANQEIEKLNKMSEALRTVINSTIDSALNPTVNHVEVRSSTSSGNVIRKICYFTLNGGIDIKYDESAWTTFRNYWLEREESNEIPKLELSGYNTSFFDNDKKILEKPDFSTECSEFYDSNGDESSTRTCGSKSAFTLSQLRNNGGEYLELANKIADSNFKRYKTRITQTSQIYDAINKRIRELNEIVSQNSGQAKEDINKKFIDVLGFDPSINNIFRMIFAHIDCFMSEYYTLLSEIKSSNRTLSTYGLDLNLTDLNPSTDPSSSFMPPFPAIYEFDDNRKVAIYPGKINKLKEMHEVKFVEDMAAGILAAKKSALAHMMDSDNNQRYDDENSANSNGFTPISVTDALRESKNPYLAYDSAKDSEPVKAAIGLLYFYIIRALQSKLQFNDDITDESLASTESKNYIRLHPTAFNEAFKQEIKRLSELSNTDLKSKLDEYIGGTSDILIGKGSNGLMLNDNGISCKYKDVVVHCDTANKSDTNNVIFKNGILENNVNKKIFDISLVSSVDIVSNVNTELATSDVNDKDKVLKRFIADPQMVLENAAAALEGGENKLGDNTKFFLGDDIGFFADAKLNDDHKYFNSSEFKNLSNGQKAAYFIAFVHHICSDRLQHGSSRGGDAGGSTWYYRKIAPFGDSSSYNSMGIKKSSVFPMYYYQVLLYGAFLSNMFKTQEDSIEIGYYAKFDEGYNGLYFEGVHPETLTFLREHSSLAKPFKDLWSEFINSRKWSEIYNLLISKDMDKQHKYNVIKAIGLPKYYIHIVRNEAGDNVSVPYSSIINFAKNINTAYDTTQTLEEQNNLANIDDAYISDGIKLSLYMSLKNLYDKWINSYAINEFKLRSPSNDRAAKNARYSMEGGTSGYNYTKNLSSEEQGHREFDNFLFVDSLYNDISYRFRINPQSICNVIRDHISANENYSVYEFMADICQENKLLFIALPVVNNFYTQKGWENVFTPMVDDYSRKGFGSTYVCMYTYEPSHVIADESKTGMPDDGLDIADVVDCAAPMHISSLFNKSSNANEIPLQIPSFAVTYGMQNQMYFKSVNVNMDNPRLTDYSIANMFEITNGSQDNSTGKPYVVANDVYSIYANRSYNCSVEMMGCANIMPMMYFQLNNIPMFRGAYMISNVKHHISAGQFTTTFSGVRISKNQIAFNDDIFNIAEILKQQNGSGSGSSGGSGGAGSNGGSGEVQCTDFDAEKAVSKVRSTAFSSSQGQCTCHVMNGVTAGTGIAHGYCGYGVEMAGPSLVKNIDPDARTKTVRDVLSKFGFEHVDTIPANSTKNYRQEWTRNKGLKGDIAIMYHGNNPWNKDKRDHIGHAAMFCGDAWYSDFKQSDMYVYPGSAPNPQQIFIFRHKGCTPSANPTSTPVSATGKGSSRYPRGSGHGNPPHSPYRIFNITRSSDWNSWNCGITSYDSLPSNQKTPANRRFCTHSSAQAACKLFVCYIKRVYFDKGLTTPRQIVMKYAPPSDGNNSAQYFKDIGDYMGISVDSRMNFDKTTICLLGEIMARIEQGINVESYMPGAFDAAKAQLGF